MSAANGALDHVKSLLHATPSGDWVSMAVVSKGEYGVPAGLMFSYPCRTDGKGNFALDEVHIDAPRTNEVLVEIKASGVCHTDFDSMSWGRSCIMGHEGAGRGNPSDQQRLLDGAG